MSADVTAGMSIVPYSEMTLLWEMIAKLRRPEGPPSGAPYSYGKQKETHELIYSWLSWPAVLLVGAYARRRRRWSLARWLPYSK